MERVVIVLQIQDQSDLTISQLNDKLGLSLPQGADPLTWKVNPDETMAKVANLIAACQGSSVDVAVKVAVTDSEPTVSLSGSGAVARTFSLSGKAYV